MAIGRINDAALEVQTTAYFTVREPVPFESGEEDLYLLDFHGKGYVEMRGAILGSIETWHYVFLSLCCHATLTTAGENYFCSNCVDQVDFRGNNASLFYTEDFMNNVEPFVQSLGFDALETVIIAEDMKNAIVSAWSVYARNH